MNIKTIISTIITAICLTLPLEARIKLTTLPERESVRIDIQNGRHTLVEEERTVNMQKGRNQVDFSWANIYIDKDSIVFRVIKANGKVNVINTNYPNNENALYWSVYSEKAGPAVIRISYLIGNMNAKPSYQGIVENDEKSMLLKFYNTVTNTSGESFDKTTIQPGQGKSEVRYFKNGERKRMLSAKFMNIPITKRYIYNMRTDSKNTRMIYRMTNDKSNQLGQFPLPYGKVRLFIKESGDQKDSVRSQAFLGEDWLKYTPLYSKLDLFVGVAKDVKVKRFIMQPEGGPNNKYVEVTAPRIMYDGSKAVTKPRYRHIRERIRYRLENFKTYKGKPISVPLTIKEAVDGEWVIEKTVLKEILGERNDTKEKEIPHNNFVSSKRIDINNVEFEVDLPPTKIDKKYDLYITILRKNRLY
jgi:hypothetical protein